MKGSETGGRILLCVIALFLLEKTSWSIGNHFPVRLSEFVTLPLIYGAYGVVLAFLEKRRGWKVGILLGLPLLTRPIGFYWSAGATSNPDAVLFNENLALLFVIVPLILVWASRWAAHHVMISKS